MLVESWVQRKVMEAWTKRPMTSAEAEELVTWLGHIGSAIQEAGLALDQSERHAKVFRMWLESARDREESAG